MTKDEALKLARKALKPFSTPNWAGTGVDKANEAITAINEALAAPVQEPDSDVTDEENEKFSRDVSNFKGADPEATKYALDQFLKNRKANPPAAQRQWVGLTDDEILAAT